MKDDNLPYVESKHNTFKAFVFMRINDAIIQREVIFKTNIGLIE